jgi:hypothetical protein
LAKLLTQISFEVSTKVRFVPSDKAAKVERKVTSKKGSVPPENPSSESSDPAPEKPEST